MIACGFSNGGSCFEQGRSFFEQGTPALSFEAECGEGSAEGHHASQGGDDGRCDLNYLRVESEELLLCCLCPAVLDQIEQHPAAKEFIEPVDRRRATNYSDVIAEPMCLADMATKVFEGIYKTPKMVGKKNAI